MALVRCVLLVLLALCAFGDGARILGIFHMPARSHHILGSRLMKELASKGHQVTFLSPFALKAKVDNLKDVVLDGINEALGSKMKDTNMYDMENAWKLGQVYFLHALGLEITDLVLQNPKTQKLLDSNEEFDLIIGEQFMNEALIGFAHRFKAPYIIISTIASNSWTNGIVSNPAPYSYVPDPLLQFPSKMCFFQRWLNAYFGFFYQMYREYYYLPNQDAVMRKYFKDAPPLTQLMKSSVSMVLLNSHPALSDPVPHVPAMVEIGGYHVEEARPLPADLKAFLDGAKDGVVLFSMGSNLRSAQLPAEKRDAILRAFGKLKQKVLWKWEEDVLPGQPDNVKLSKWLPQNDIMAHPNLRAFITHGGLLSTTEAVYHGVPVIGIPIFGDQKTNIVNAVNKQYGLAVYYQDLSEETLTKALNEVLNKPKYRNNAKRLSAILRDQPMKPIDTANFWIEHVLRHGGANHLRTAANDLEWYQLYLVDIWTFKITVDTTLFILAAWLLKRWCCKKTDAKKNMKKKQK